MKKTIRLLLVFLLLVPMLTLAACSAAEEKNKPGQKNAQEENAPADQAPEADPSEAAISGTEAAGELKAGKGTILEQMDDWHWRTFECQYIDGNGEFGGLAPGGHYENDEMADFIAQNPEWYRDTAMMGVWETADAPFGDCINASLAADTPFMNDKLNNHGLMVYKTFNITDLSDDITYDLCMFYDNTVYCYINGEPFFILDGNLVKQDWNGGYDLIKCNQQDGKTLKDFLHTGENYICVSIKDAWGGREFDCTINYEKGSTKRDLIFVDQNQEWNYTVFYCPYIDGEGNTDGLAPGGHFEPDEMADYIAANPNFMTDTATASSWAVGKAPMSSGAEGWTGSNHGLMLYKSFNVDSLDEIKAADEIDWFGDYDNAIHVWLNGVEIYTDDGKCAVRDWQTNGVWALDKDLVLTILKNGENCLFVTIKDAWGGRDFNCGLKAHWN
ncbi:MAG: hypothetical protein IKQ92_12225 [Clostridia bacterium]|nr:hypothetical protein [Clostridia bacterium]